MENFRCHLKWSIRGTYVHVNAKHLNPYLDEPAYRYHERVGTDADRFVKAVKSVAGKRLTDRQLTDNHGPGGHAAN